MSGDRYTAAEAAEFVAVFEGTGEARRLAAVARGDAAPAWAVLVDDSAVNAGSVDEANRCVGALLTALRDDPAAIAALWAVRCCFGDYHDTDIDRAAWAFLRERYPAICRPAAP